MLRNIFCNLRFFEREADKEVMNSSLWITNVDLISSNNSSVCYRCDRQFNKTRDSQYL